MHDLLERVCSYVFHAMIKAIIEKGYITLQLLNTLIKEFDFTAAGANKPPEIKTETTEAW